MSVKTPIVVMLALLLITSCRTTAAQTFSPISDFVSLSLPAMDSVRVKLTFGGLQDRPVSSVVVAVPGAGLAGGTFETFQRAGFDYYNDSLAVRSIRASRIELKRLVDSVAVSLVGGGGVSPGGTTSFAILSTSSVPPKCFEAIVNDTTGPLLFQTLLHVLQTNPEADGAIRRFGCETVMLPKSPPSTLEGQATVAVTGLRRDRAKKSEYLCTVRVHNTSASTIAGPVILVVRQSGGDAELVARDGTTCNISPLGSPFLRLKLSLAPGATIQRTLRFKNPSGQKFDVLCRLFAGEGIE
jgi:hypothetical protein